MKRNTSGINMLLAVDKPTGMTSHDVVNICRQAFNERRVGHMGTLDPLATGVMLIGVGSYTRLNQFLESHNKTYVVTATFGQATNTYDAEGEVTENTLVPKEFLNASFANEVVVGMVGKQQQKPPAFSAIKINGRPAYKAARKGQKINLPVREIEVYATKLIDVQDNSWIIELTVSKGAYIRSLVHDLGQMLGVPAYVKNLKRIRLGCVSLDDCVKVEELQSVCNENLFKSINPVDILGFEKIEADSHIHAAVLHGNQFAFNTDKQYKIGQNVCVIINNQLGAIYSCAMVNNESTIFKAKIVLAKN